MASSYLQVLSDQHTASGVVPPGVSKPNSTFGQSSNLRVQLGKPSKLRGESKNVQTSRPNYPEHIRQNMDRERSTELRYLWTDSPIGHVSLPCLLANLFYKLFPFLPRASGLTVGQLAGWRIFFLQVLHCAIRIWRRCRDWMKCGVEMCWEKTWKGGILGPPGPQHLQTKSDSSARPSGVSSTLKGASSSPFGTLLDDYCHHTAASERTGSSEKKSATCFFHTKKWFPTDYSILIIFLTFPYILLKDVGENRPFSKDVCLAPAAGARGDRILLSSHGHFWLSMSSEFNISAWEKIAS